MSSFSFLRWVKSLVSSPRTPIQKRPRVRLSLEYLEDRLAPATFAWDGGGGNDHRWSNPLNWAGNVRPTGTSTAHEDLIFPSGVPAASHATLNDLNNAFFNSITLSDAGYSFTGNKITLGDPTNPSGGYIIVTAGSVNNAIGFDIQMGGVSQQFFTVQSGANLTLSGHLSGSIGLTKEGQGTLTLSNDNTAFTGQIKIDSDSGILAITNVNALGATSTGTTVANNSQLQINIPTGTISEPLIVNGVGPGANGAVFTVTGTNVTWAGNVVMDSDAAFGGNSGTTLNITGQVSDTGVGHNLMKEGTSTVILGSANTYRGGTVVDNGVLDIRNAQALGEPLPGGALPSTANGTIVNQNLITGTAGTLEIEDTSGVGFTVQSEIVTLNGSGFTNKGSLFNLKGNNTWNGSVFLGSGIPNNVLPWIAVAEAYTLTVNSVISDPNANTGFNKTDAGTLVLTNANTYHGKTTVVTGILNIRDSQALGSASGSTSVMNNATLQLEVDSKPDSVTGSITSLIIADNIALNGTGFNRLGALDSVSGINRWTGNITMVNTPESAEASIGVEADATPSGDSNYFTNDDSLTVTGIINDPLLFLTPATFDKFGKGNLILTGTNTYSGLTDIQDGWVTAQNNQALGGRLKPVVDNHTVIGFTDVPPFPQDYVYATHGIGDNVQSGTTVELGAALLLKPLSAGGSLSLFEHLTLMGSGITHPFNNVSQGGISQEGALLSVDGNNTITGNVTLMAQAGVGTAEPRYSSINELALTGEVSEKQPVINVNTNFIGPSQQKETIIDPGTTAGSMVVNYQFHTAADRMTIYLGTLADANRVQLIDTGFVSFAGTITITYTPTSAVVNLKKFDADTNGNLISNTTTTVSYAPFLTPPKIDIVVDEGGNPQFPTTAWDFNAKVTPAGVIGGGIAKLGNRRLVLEGNATYTGANEVKEGALRVRSDTAFGTGAGGTTVDAGAALEVQGVLASLNGGVGRGIQMWGEHLTLAGTGNTTATPGSTISTLSVLSDDNLWRGPLSLKNDMTFDIQGTARFTITGAIDDAANLAPNGSSITKTGTGKLVLAGANSYRGVTNINQGIVNLQNGSALGAVGPNSGTVVANGASLELQGDITIAGETLTLNGAGPSSAPANPNTSWFQIGPAPIANGQTQGNENVTGRVTGISVDPSDPNTIYISTAGGGAWKTNNGGKTWLPITDNIPDIATNPSPAPTIFSGAIAVSTRDPRVIYMGTGESNNSGDSFYGRGIMKSIDSGKTWTLLTGNPGLDELVGRTIAKIVVDPLNANVIYVAVSEFGINGQFGNAGIWKYDGFSWTNLTSLAGAPTDGGTAFFSGFDDWSDVAVIVDPVFAGNRFLLGAVGSFDGFQFNNATYISLDDGVTWTLNGQPLSYTEGPFTYPYAGNIKVGFGTQIFPPDPVFQLVPPPTYHLYAAVDWPTNVSPSNAAKANTLRELRTNTISWDANNLKWIVGGWSPNTTVPNIGAQTSYDTVLIVDPRASLASALPQPTYNILYLAGVGNPFTQGPLISLNGGQSWTDIGTGADGKGPHADSHGMALDSNNRLVIGNDGGVWRLDNATPGSIKWTNLSGNLAITTFNGVDVHPTNPNIIIGGTQDNGTEIFNGSSLTWTHVEDGDGGAAHINQTNPNIMFHVLNGTLRRSTTGGAQGSWNTVYTLWAVQNGVGELYFPFALDKVNSSRVLLGDTFPFLRVTPVLDIDGTGNGLFESLDGGNTYTNLTKNLFYFISFYGPVRYEVSVFAAATYQGVFTTDPGNPDQPDPGFPLVTDKGVNTYDPDTIYISDSVSIFLTKNHGLTWVDRTDNLNQVIFDNQGNVQSLVQDVAVDPTNRNTAYVITGPSFPNASVTGRIFRTTTAGLSINGAPGWEEITGDLPAGPAHKIIIDPRTGDLFVGNDLGVYRLKATDAANGNFIWKRFGVGLPDVQVTDMVLNQTLNTIVIGTYGRSAFQIFLDDYRPNAGALRSLSGSAIWTGPVFLAGDSTISANGNQAIQNGVGNAQLTILGTIADAPGLPAGTHPKLTKAGKGNVVLAGANTYTGLTDVAEGVLVIQNPSALGANPSNGGDGTIVENGAAINLQSNLTGEPLQLNGDGFLYNGHSSGALRNTSNNNIYTGNITLGSDVTIGVDTGTSLTINNTGTGKIDDAGAGFGITKELSGTLILGGNNTYDGFTKVNQGILQITNAHSLGTDVGGTNVRDGAQLQIQGGITIVNEALLLSGLGVFGTGALLNTGGNNKWQGPVTLTSLAGFSPTTIPPSDVSISVANAADTLTIDGPISDDDPGFGLFKIGAGTLVLTQSNLYRGTTTVAAGVLRITDPFGLGTSDGGTVVNAGAALELAGGAGGFTVADEALTLNGNGVSPGNAGAVRNLSGANTWTGNVLLATNSSIGVDSGSLDVQGTLADNGAPSSPSSLTKVGAGRLQLDAFNTYRGTTTINAGDVQVDGVINNVSLNGGSVSGTGVVGTITTLTSGKVSPGDNGSATPTGSLTSGSAVWNANTTFFVNLSDVGNFDSLAVTGNINLNAALLAGTVGPGVNLNDTFTILTTTGGTITGTFGNTVSGAIFIGGAKFLISYTSTSVVLTRSGVTSVTMAVSSSASPSSYGQIVNFIATFTPEAGAGTLNGQGVTYVLDGNAADTQTAFVVNNVATLPANAFAAFPLSIGAHTIAVSFNQSGFTPASGTINQQVNKATTSTTLAASSSSAAFGQSVTFTATVIPSGFNPAPLVGLTVTFLDGATTLGTGSLDVNGKATFTTSTLTATSHSITAVFAGNANYGGSTSAALVFNVTKATSTTTVTSSLNPSVFGDAVTLTATVTPTVNGVLPTGLVTFKDVTVPATPITLGTVSLANVAGTAVATFTTGATDFTGGTHTIVAVYAGDVNFNSSNSANFAQTVNKHATTSTITQSSANPSGAGQAVTFTVTVTPGVGAFVPTGTLTFMDGATTLGTSTLLANVGGVATATFTTSSLAEGSHTISAVYAGDTNFSASTSANFSQVVLRASTTTLTSSLNPSPFGTSVTFTADVSGTGGTPTGTVTFSVDGNPQAPQNLPGPVTFTPANLSAGTHTITATYSGDAIFGISSATLTQTVNQAATTTTLVVAPPTTSFGQLVTMTAHVASAAGVPVGSVTFKDGATSLGAVAVDGSGNAVFTTSTLSVGTHSITAVFNLTPAGNFATSTSAASSEVVSLATSTTAVTSSVPAGSVFGQAVSFSATVTPAGGLPSSLSGQTVTFMEGATVLNTATINASGVAIFTTSSLVVGSHVITASFAGTTNVQASSGTVTQAVAKAASTLTLTASPASSTFGQSVTFTAAVGITAPGAATLTGQTVTFLDGATSLGTGTLDATGKATLTTSALVVASHSITANYAGNASVLASSGNIPSYVVAKATSTTTLTSSANPGVTGQSITFTATVNLGTSPASLLTGQIVTFKDGLTTLGTGTLTALGTATFTTATLTAGTHSITAAYAGTANITASTSAPLSEKIGITTALTVASSAASAALGSPVTFTATILAATGGLASLVGQTITFKDGATTLGTGTLNSLGKATFTTSTLAGGSHSITVSYAGDGTHNPSTSVAFNQVIFLPASALIATVNPVQPLIVSPFTITVTAKDSNGNTDLNYNKPASLTVLSKPAGATVTIPTPTMANGVLTFTGLQVSAIGTYTFQITWGSLVINVTFTATAIGRR
ncbi:MAG: Ig-like domain repeat protein [Planctomycetes bacterium]|nr:Ig-like domain repeat protein [Planctomycetota bacterium]